MTLPNPKEVRRTQATHVANKPPATKAAPSPRLQDHATPKATIAAAPAKTNLRRGSGAVSPRPGSKTAKILVLLKRPGGATLKDLQKATGWQAHSIRGLLSGTVAGKMGLKVSSIKPESGERRYAVKP